MTAKVKFDFYRVTYKDDKNPVTFDQILNELIALPKDERLAKINDEECLCLQSLEKHHIVALLFTRVRMDRLPEKTKLTGARAPLDLDDDEGLGEDVVIAYYHRWNVLAVQRNVHSLSVNGILVLIKKLVPECNIELVPILRDDALKRMLNLKQLKKLSIKIDGTKDTAFLSSIPELQGKMGPDQWFQAPYLELTFSTGRKNQTLSEQAYDFVKGLAIKLKGGDRPASLCKLEVSGRETDDDPTVVLDLLEDRFIDEHPVTSIGRSVNPHSLLEAAIGVIKKNIVSDASELKQS